MKTQKYKITSKSGFTLVELLVVLTIIVVLSAISVIAYSGQLIHFKISTHNSNIEILKSAAMLAIAENGLPEAHIEWTGPEDEITSNYDSSIYIPDWPEIPSGLDSMIIKFPGYLGNADEKCYGVYIDHFGVIQINQLPIKEIG